MQRAWGLGVCALPKPPSGRALSEGKEAPQAAFPSWCFPAQTKRRSLLDYLAKKDINRYRALIAKLGICE